MAPRLRSGSKLLRTRDSKVSSRIVKPGWPEPILFEGANALARQIFATKSIDKLISESERPEHALKKTLGPVSLTALGIGAVIGSGIFTVIGVAIGGNPAELASWADSPVIDLLLHHGAVAGRPGAGPALAISLVLVAT